MTSKKLLRQFKESGGRVTELTGAGISAESDIPTFRGPEGYWTVGSKEYRPEEMATQAMFAHAPWEVWAWYLYRRTASLYTIPQPVMLSVSRYRNFSCELVRC